MNVGSMLYFVANLKKRHSGTKARSSIPTKDQRIANVRTSKIEDAGYKMRSTRFMFRAAAYRTAPPLSSCSSGASAPLPQRHCCGDAHATNGICACECGLGQATKKESSRKVIVFRLICFIRMCSPARRQGAGVKQDIARLCHSDPFRKENPCLCTMGGNVSEAGASRRKKKPSTR